MAKKKRKIGRLSTAAKLNILRLAAQALDTRRGLTMADIRRVPSLSRAFQALDAVIVELDWDGAKEDKTSRASRQQ